MQFEIYYHPSASLTNITNSFPKNNHPLGILNISPLERYLIKFNNEDKNLQHLPDSIFYNLKDSYKLNIEKDGTIRNDRALNLIRDSIYENHNISTFLIDPEPQTVLNEQNASRLVIVAFGEEFQIANRHISSSPIKKDNKALFIAKFYEYSMPINTITDDNYKKLLNKF